MSLSLTIKIAWKNIAGNKLRSSLTILGLVIGIASVILLVGLVNGATDSISDEISSMGADLISVEIYEDSYLMTYEELNEMLKLDKVSGVSPKSYLDGSVNRNGRKYSAAEILGVGDGYISMMGLELAHGRDISRLDIDNNTKCVIIGSDVARKLWKGSPAYGTNIKINGDDYTVIGVLKSVGSSMGDNVDAQIMLPLSAAAYLGQSAKIRNFYVRADSKDDTEEACDEVKEFLQKQKKLNSDNCYISTQQQMVDAMKEVTNTMALLLGGIASISLLVGGIGVMNVMLVSVTERTKEIGIRKSLGAKRKDIVWQFLIESVVLSLTGGIIGVLLGIAGGKIATLAGAYFSPSIGMILLACGVSIGIGLIFGSLPAYRAAKLRPVEALRYE